MSQNCHILDKLGTGAKYLCRVLNMRIIEFGGISISSCSRFHVLFVL